MRYFKFAISFVLMVILATGFISAKSKSYISVISVSGRAEYLPAGEALWKNAKVGIRLYSGDSIKTHENSYVEIAFDTRKKNVVNIKSDTYVVLKLEDAEKIELIDGEVFSLVKKLPKGSRFEIRTPTAICGARGTGWGANANKERTVVSAYEDDSYAMGINKDGTLMEETIVREGFQTIVERFERPSKLMKIMDRDFERWHGWKDDLIERTSARRITRERLARDIGKIQEKQEKIEERKAKVEERRDAEKVDRRSEDTGAGGGELNRKIESPGGQE